MEDVVYTDYANWLLESDDLIKKLKKEESFLYYRYKHILSVLSYLYDVKVDKNDLTEEEDAIFSVGFSFLFNQYEQVNLLLKHTYNDNLQELHQQQKTIELLISIHEFQIDIEAIMGEEEMVEFIKLEEEVNDYINQRTEAPEELFNKLDIISTKVYEDNNQEYYPINEIFFDIAVEYNLVD